MGITASILSIILGLLCIFQGYATYHHAKTYNKEVNEILQSDPSPRITYLVKHLGMLKKENTWVWVVLGILWLALGITSLC